MLMLSCGYSAVEGSTHPNFTKQFIDGKNLHFFLFVRIIIVGMFFNMKLLNV